MSDKKNVLSKIGIAILIIFVVLAKIAAFLAVPVLLIAMIGYISRETYRSGNDYQEELYYSDISFSELDNVFGEDTIYVDESFFQKFGFEVPYEAEAFYAKEAREYMKNISSGEFSSSMKRPDNIYGYEFVINDNLNEIDKYKWTKIQLVIKCDNRLDNSEYKNYIKNANTVYKDFVYILDDWDYFIIDSSGYIINVHYFIEFSDEDKVSYDCILERESQIMNEIIIEFMDSIKHFDDLEEDVPSEEENISKYNKNFDSNEFVLKQNSFAF